MSKAQLKELIINADTTASDEDFRGSLERFLLASAIGLKGLALGGTTEIDKLYLEIFDGLIPFPATNTTSAAAKRREKALVRLLQIYGHSKGFIQNVVESGMVANDTLFRSLLTVKTTKMFLDPYTGAGCVARMKSIVKLAKAEQKTLSQAKAKTAK